MTAPHDPDDLASALLDGLLTDDEAAVARRDPAVAARLAELAAVRQAVRRPPAGPDPVARERGLAAALAAFEAGDGAPEQRGAGVSAGTTVSPVGRRRAATTPAAARAGTPWRPRGTAGRRWLTAAAAIVLAVVGLGVLASNWDTGSDDADTAARDASATSSDDADGSGSGLAEESEGGTTEESAAPTVAPGGIVDLGDVASSEALAERARSALADGFPSPLGQASGGQDAAAEGGGGGPSPSQCAGAAGAGRLPAAGETIVLEARATLDGDIVDVWVLTADGKERVVAVDATCAVVVDRPLD
jgi:hypothetical protein